jgi:hypothetical protein
MKYAFVAGLIAIAGVNGARTSFVMSEDGEPVEHLRRVPEGWNELGPPSANHKMNFRIAVRSVSRLNILILLVCSVPFEISASANIHRPIAICSSAHSWTCLRLALPTTAST